MQKNYIYRGGFYLVGLLVLALGISLNTKTGLGVSPIISVSYSISTIWNLNFGNMTMVLYCIFVLVEMLLHTILCRKELKREDIALEHANEMNLKLVLIMDLLQIPLSLVFTRFLNVFGAWIPDLKTDCAGSFAGTFAGRLFFLIIAIILTGIGAAMSLNMRIIPNPGDGIVQAIADTIHKSTGFTKNCFDLFNICVTISVGLIFAHHLVGIGLGTVLAVIGVGRAIAAFNYLFYEKTKTLAGLYDMYPLYWTTSKEGIFMRYSYEFKMMCVELYHSGSYPDIPEGLNPNTLKRHIREWSRLVDLHGPEVLKHKVFNKVWTPEEKLELISKVIAGTPRTKVAIEAGINAGLLYQWVHKYKLQGYNGLVESKKGRPTKEPRMKKSTNPLPLTESEREELIRLRTENEYIKAENEVIKKRIALRQEKWVAQLKAKKQQSSKNSEKKDTN